MGASEELKPNQTIKVGSLTPPAADSPADSLCRIHKSIGCSDLVNKISIPTQSSVTILIDTHKLIGNK